MGSARKLRHFLLERLQSRTAYETQQCVTEPLEAARCTVTAIPAHTADPPRGLGKRVKPFFLLSLFKAIL